MATLSPFRASLAVTSGVSVASWTADAIVLGCELPLEVKPFTYPASELAIGFTDILFPNGERN